MGTRSFFLISLFSMVASHSAKAQTQLGSPINGPTEGGLLGWSLSLSNDGNKIAVRNITGARTESIRVLNYDGNNWIPLGNDIPNDFTVVPIGISLSYDGTKLAFERSVPIGNTTDLTSFRVYSFNGNTWSQLGTDIGEEQGQNSGFATVALSADGLKIVTSSKIDFGNNVSQTKVRVHRFDGNNWVQSGNDIEVQNGNNTSACSLVAISSDGSKIAVSNPHSITNPLHSGKTRIYNYNGATWTQLGTDINPENSNDSQVWSIAVSSDGNKIAIGNEEPSSSTGKVRIFEYDGANWIQLGNTLLSTQVIPDNFGFGMDLSADGTKIAIGAMGNDTNGEDSGNVRIFQYNGSSWEQIGTPILGAEVWGNFGQSVSMSDDGTRVAVGAPNNGPTFTGQATIYDLSGILFSDEFVSDNSLIYPNPVTDELFIKLEQGLELQKINLYSSEGRLVKTTTASGMSAKIALGNTFARGLYLVELITQKGKATKKIILK